MADAKKDDSDFYAVFTAIEALTVLFLIFGACEVAKGANHSTLPHPIVDACVMFFFVFVFIAGAIGRRIYEVRIVIPVLTERIRKHKEDQAALHEKRKAVLTPDVIPDDIIRWRFFGMYLKEDIVEEWVNELSAMAVRIEKKHGAVEYGKGKAAPIALVNTVRKVVRDSIRDGMSNGATSDINAVWDWIVEIVAGDRYGSAVLFGKTGPLVWSAEYMKEYIHEKQLALAECD